VDLVTLGRTLGFSFAAGVNLYATVAILGLAARYGWVELPPQFDAFNNRVVIGIAIVMYLVEFFADKIPYFDSLWDLIHTAIRPVGGALIAVTTLGDQTPTVEALAALLGGTVAAGSHLTKTSTRAVVNTSPEPFSNWILSVGEDLFVVGLGYLALRHPVGALVVATLLFGLIVVFAAAIIRTTRRWFSGKTSPARTLQGNRATGTSNAGRESRDMTS
jgi:hypothetical protein